jgi:putative nucleotidyltransferase with HDIG domain
MTGETIMIVEDNDALRDGIKELLRNDGFAVLAARNGREALQQMRTFSPDLILSDITMPEMDGKMFLESVRARSEWLHIPIIFLSGHSGPADILAGKKLGVEDYLTKPIDPDDLITTIRSKLDRARQTYTAQLEKAYAETLIILANRLEGQDRYTRYHVERISSYALEIASSMGWQERKIKPLRFGAILHDIGKNYIPGEILRKNGPLTQEEWALIRQHPIFGVEMIRDIYYLEPAIPIIRHHHERWDGKGYPDKLSGDNIPEGARIVLVADAFDAMTTNRPYSMARSLEDAYQEIVRNSGTQFDPGVVAAFERVWKNNGIQSIYENWREGS